MRSSREPYVPPITMRPANQLRLSQPAIYYIIHIHIIHINIIYIHTIHTHIIHIHLSPQSQCDLPSSQDYQNQLRLCPKIQTSSIPIPKVIPYYQGILPTGKSLVTICPPYHDGCQPAKNMSQNSNLNLTPFLPSFLRSVQNWIFCH